MPPYCKESHFVEYARSNSSNCAFHSIQDQSIISIVITNNFIGEEVTLYENSVCGYKMMGFKTMSEYEESNIFSLRLEVPIPFLSLETHIPGKNMVITSYHQFCQFQVEKKYNSMILFWKCLLALLQTDLDGNLYSTPNCHSSAKIEGYLSNSSQVT
jgi:hypothetical protein